MMSPLERDGQFLGLWGAAAVRASPEAGPKLRSSDTQLFWAEVLRVDVDVRIQLMKRSTRWRHKFRVPRCKLVRCVE